MNKVFSNSCFLWDVFFWHARTKEHQISRGVPRETITNAIHNLEADEKALEDGSVPKKYGSLLNKAKDAVQKLLKQGTQLLKEKELAHKSDDLKNGYRTLTKHVTDLENVLTLEDLPDGQKLTKANMDKFIGLVAKDVDLWNGELQALQGFLKAKKWWRLWEYRM